MRTRAFISATALAASSLLTGCGGDHGAGASVGCLELGRAVLDEIADGLVVKADVVGGWAVELPLDEQKYGFEWVAAVKVSDKNGDQTTVLGLDNPKDPRLIANVDAMSEVYFQWGGAAQKGSPMATYQRDLDLSDASKTAQDCL